MFFPSWLSIVSIVVAINLPMQCYWHRIITRKSLPPVSYTSNRKPEKHPVCDPKNGPPKQSKTAPQILKSMSNTYLTPKTTYSTCIGLVGASEAASSRFTDPPMTILEKTGRCPKSSTHTQVGNWTTGHICVVFGSLFAVSCGLLGGGG